LDESRKTTTVRKIIFIALAVLVLALVIGGFVGYRYVQNSLAPMNENSEEVVEVEIPTGSSSSDIGAILEENELINNSTIFDYYVRFEGDNNFQAGAYTMSPAMSVEEMVDALNEGGTAIAVEPNSRLTIPEGIHIEEIAARVEENSEFSASEFMDIIENQSFTNELQAQYPDLLTDALEAADVTRYVLEGYLFPATYGIYDDTTLEGLITNMVERMDQALQPHYEDIAASDLNVHEILTLASYIEREGTTAEDREMISGVFYNRLEEGMPLQTDPSVSYALGEHRERTSYEDLEVDSPYNTYMYNGIGAGPINSPSESAIHASVNPVATDYMYFLADLDTGNIYYSENYDQHIEYQNEYLRDNN